MKTIFDVVSSELRNNEEKILAEMNSVQGNLQDIKGYFLPDNDAVSSAMRPSKTLNAIIDNL